MRFRRIEIPAYGPFTNFSVEFPRGRSDFHLVYGPNEAGKSSLLRAMRSFLFGIPGRTEDNFRHEYNQLRIRAEVEDSEGRSRIFQRRKGQRDTLLDEAGNSVAESELRDMLGAVDEAYFSSLFGLGSEELRKGADELLRGEGRLGEALFSASLGGTPVDAVIRALEEEAELIFSGRAKRRIREATRKYNEHQREKKDHLVKPEAWEEIERGLAETDARLTALVATRRDHFARKEWLERCRGALPIVGQLAERSRQIETLAGLPELSREFPGQLRSVGSARAAAAREVDQLVRERSRLEAGRTACPLRPETLAEATRIDRLHTDLGTYRENLRAAEARRGEAAAKEQTVRAMCRDLGIVAPLDQLGPLRITLPRFNEAEQLVRRLTAAAETLSETERRIQERESELARLRAEPLRGDTKELRHLSELIHRAAGVETLAANLVARTEALSVLERALRSSHRELSGAPADLETARELPVPSRSRLEKFREWIEENRRLTQTLADEDRGAGEEIRRIEAEIERYSRQRDVPSLEALDASRDQRNHQWNLVLEAWKGVGDGETLVEGKPLEQTYPEAVKSADQIADRLRLEAEAVAQLEELRTKLKLERVKKADLESRISEARQVGAELSEQWSSLWESCHPDPASPSEMIEWRESWQEFCRQWEQWSNERGQIAADREKVAAVATVLSEALASTSGSAGGDFAGSLAGVRDRREHLDAARDRDSARDARISDLEAELKSAREDLPEREKEYKSARAEWESGCAALHLPSAAVPASSIEALRSRREMFREYDLWSGLLEQVEGLQERATRFEEEVRTLAATLGIAGATVELQEAALWSSLEDAKRAQTEHDGFQRQIADIDERLAEAGETCQREKERFDEMVLQTGLADPVGLETLLSQVEQCWDHRDKVTEWRDHLAGLAQGRSVDDFIEKVQAENPATLQEEIAGLDHTLEQLEEEIESARAARQDWEGKRAAMENAQDTAAGHEQAAAFAASAMHSDAERFVRLRIAIALLRSQIDTFRRQNQGPFMEKSSHWFSEITGGSFRAIGTSYQNGDEPVIAGLRGDPSHPEEVLVSGMSEGTRDQLYLALRFAGLELHLQDHEAMPMILDDLLVHFDDSRAGGALKGLSHLGRGSQVFLFTHHAHMVELARSVLGTDDFQLVEIA